MKLSKFKRELKKYLEEKQVEVTTTTEHGYTFGRLYVTKRNGVTISYSLPEQFEAAREAISEYLTSIGMKNFVFETIKDIRRGDRIKFTLTV